MKWVYFNFTYNTPTPDKTETMGKRLCKSHFKQGWTCKDRNKAGMKKLKITTLLGDNGNLLSGLQHKALASIVHCILWVTTVSELGMQADYCIGVQKGGQHCFVAGYSVFDFSHPCLVSVPFTGPSLLKVKFYRNFSLVVKRNGWGKFPIKLHVCIHVCSALLALNETYLQFFVYFLTGH